MPRYYFRLNIADNAATEDIEGSDLPDLDAAREYAVRAARELLAYAILWGGLPPPESIAVLDEESRIVLTVFTIDVLPARIRKQMR